MSPAKQFVVKEQLEEMVKAGIVEPSHSGWASPVVLVPNSKYNRDTRITLRYSHLYYHRPKQWLLAGSHGTPK